MQRKELKKYAQNYGFDVTETQIENWHKNHIIPPPVQYHIQGKAGSISEYPPSSKKNLILACTSEHKRSLEKMLLDVWLRGGEVDIEKIRILLLNGHFKTMFIFFNALGKNLNTVGTFIQKNYKKLEKSILLKKNDLITFASLEVNIMSPKIKESIWKSDGIEVLTGEEPIADTFSRIMGSMFDMENKNNEGVLDELKQDLNFGILEKTISQAPGTDFFRARADLPILKLFMEAQHLMFVYQDKVPLGIKMINKIPMDSYGYKSLSIIALLRLYKGERERTMTSVLHLVSNDVLNQLRNHIELIKYLKKHPKLNKKRSGWIKYFQSCDKETRKELLSYIRRFNGVNSEKFLKQIGLNHE